jgi:hypothetical protein
VRTSAVVLLIVAGALYPVAADCQTAQATATQGGWNLSTRGDVTVDFERATSGSTVFAGQTIHTGRDGAALISVPQRGTIFIAPDSTAKIANKNNQFVSLLEGTVGVNSFINGIIVVGGGAYTVVPEVTTATTYEVDQGLSGSASVSCLSGSIRVTSSAGVTLLTVRAGDEAVIPVDSAPAISSGAPTARNRLRLEYLLLAGAAAFAAYGVERAVVSSSAP